MIKRTCIALALILLAPLAQAKPQLHVIIAADTTDKSIGEGIRANVERMQTFIAKVKGADIDVVEVDVLATDFSCRNILAAASALDIKSEDAVLFYYSGHGFRRNSTQTKFPEFYCMKSHDDEPLELPQVVRTLRLKQPRFLLAIADACNKGRDATAGGELYPLDLGRNPKNGLRHLFLDYEGTIVLSGAIPGEFSWYLNSGDDAGGYFTRQFLSSVAKIVKAEPRRPQWDPILLSAIRQITIPNPPGTQDPQWAGEFKERTIP